MNIILAILIAPVIFLYAQETVNYLTIGHGLHPIVLCVVTVVLTSLLARMSYLRGLHSK